MIARLRRSESGLTLIELLVAMSIFAILLAMISALGARIFRTTTSVVATTQSEGYYQSAMRIITRQMRYAGGPDGNTPAFDTVDGSQIIFYTYSLLNGLGSVSPNKVRIWVDASNNLWESQTAPSVVGGVTVYTSTPIVKLLVSNVVNTTANPVFTFYDSPSLTGANVVPNGTGMTLAQRQSLKRATVTLQSSKNTVVTVQQTVVFQNLL